MPTGIPRVAPPPTYIPSPEVSERAMKRIVELAMPQKVNGVWRKPKLSRRKINVMRKAAAVAGREFPLLPDEKLKIWQAPRGPHIEPKLPKHRRSNELLIQMDNIVKSLEKMPQMIYEKKKNDLFEKRKERKGLDLFKPYPDDRYAEPTNWGANILVKKAKSPKQKKLAARKMKEVTARLEKRKAATEILDPVEREAKMAEERAEEERKKQEALAELERLEKEKQERKLRKEAAKKAREEAQQRVIKEQEEMRKRLGLD
jgi:hypothetical protein